jgi:phage-related protein
MAATGERTVKVKFDGSAAGLAAAAAIARRELKKVEDAQKRQVESNKKHLAGALGAIDNVILGFGRMALAIGSLASGIGIIMGIVSAVAALSGALLLVPGAIAAMGLAMVTVKLGADGIKKAFEALTPTLDKLKASVSKTFEKGLAPAVQNLKTIIPQLTPGFQGIAAAMSKVAVDVTGFLKTSAGINGLKSLLGSTKVIVQNLGAAVTPLVAAFLRLGQVGASSLADLTAGAGAAAQRFNEFVQRAVDSGQVKGWIDGAIAAFKSLGAILGDVGHILASVFSALSDAGVGLGGTLGVIIGQIRAFIDSAQGQEVLRSMAEAIKAIGDAVGTVLGAALQAVAPLIPPLASAFSQLVTQVAAFLVPAIQKLGPILAGLATFLAQNMSWLGPIAIAIGAIAVAIQAVILAVKLWQAVVIAYTVVQWLLNAAMDANPIGVVILAIGALIAIILLIIDNLDFFRGIWDAVWKWCSDRVSEVVDFIIALWNAYVIIFNDVVGAIREAWDAVWKWVSDRVSDVTGWIGRTWDSAGETIKSVFRGIGSFIGGIWDGVVSGVKGAINAVIRIINGAIGGVNKITGVVGIPAIPSIPLLAKGGVLRAGQTAIVGERGPELFTAGKTGRVQTNADSFGGSGSGSGDTRFEFVFDLGAGITQRMEATVDANNRATLRALQTGSGLRR